MGWARSPGWIEIDGRRYQRSLRLTPEGIDAHWGPGAGEALAEAHLAGLATFTGYVILLGTGLRQRFPPPPLLRALTEAGVAPGDAHRSPDAGQDAPITNGVT